MASNSKGPKIKIIKSNVEGIKVITKDTSRSDLEKVLNKKSGLRFISPSKTVIPILESGGFSDEPVQIEDIASEANVPNREAREENTTTPEFSVYELSRNQERNGTSQAGGQYRTSSTSTAGNDPNSLSLGGSQSTNRGMNFANPELERWGAENERGGKSYDVTIKVEEAKKERRLPWE